MLLHCTAFGAHRMEMVKTAVSAVSSLTGMDGEHVVSADVLQPKYQGKGYRVQ